MLDPNPEPRVVVHLSWFLAVSGWRFRALRDSDTLNPRTDTAKRQNRRLKSPAKLTGFPAKGIESNKRGPRVPCRALRCGLM